MAWLGLAWLNGLAWEAWLGLAWEAWLGLAWLGCLAQKGRGLKWKERANGLAWEAWLGLGSLAWHNGLAWVLGAEGAGLKMKGESHLAGKFCLDCPMAWVVPWESSLAWVLRQVRQPMATQRHFPTGPPTTYIDDKLQEIGFSLQHQAFFKLATREPVYGVIHCTVLPPESLFLPCLPTNIFLFFRKF